MAVKRKLDMKKETRKYSDRRRYIIAAVAKRRREIRLKVIKSLGGHCKRCGYDKYPEVLEFHHRDPAQKDFNISKKGHCRSWKRVEKEIKKCDLLCANCHREIHVENRRLAASMGNCRMNSE